ncbi:MAG: AAA family ATPase [Candidatus Ornithospirochaeta sp.]
MNGKETVSRLKENIRRVIVGRDDTISLLLAAIVTGGHVLLLDMPGTGKTKLAKSLARSMGVDYGRIQFTPDLLPSDVLGLNYYSQKEGEFVFKKGPVFTSVLLADEINRATPRTQSSLLECMEERQVTVDGVTRVLEEPFFVIATENPIETAGTYPLPEAQSDRFMMVLEMGYPTREEEVAIMERFYSSDPLDSLSPVIGREEIIAMRKEAEGVFIHPLLLDYIASISEATRKGEGYGVSPRGTLALMKGARAWAMMEGRDYVVPDDIKHIAPAVLSHRLDSDRRRGEKIISSILSSLPVPVEDWGRR